MNKAAIFCLALAGLVGIAHGENSIPPTIVVGERILLPDTANQTIYFAVTGDTDVQAIAFELQVGDGGLLAGGQQNGPIITNLDVVTGTVFAGHYDFERSVNLVPQLAYRGTMVDSSTPFVVANGRVATAVISTVGFDSGTWDLKITDTKNGTTAFGDLPALLTNGSITIAADVPEPGTLIVLAAGALLLLARRRASHSA